MFQDDLGIRIVNGREAEAIAHRPGDSDEDELDNDMEEEGKHQFKIKNKKSPTKLSMDPWKKMLESEFTHTKIMEISNIHKK